MIRITWFLTGRGHVKACHSVVNLKLLPHGAISQKVIVGHPAYGRGWGSSKTWLPCPPCSQEQGRGAAGVCRPPPESSPAALILEMGKLQPRERRGLAKSGRASGLSTVGPAACYNLLGHLQTPQDSGSRKGMRRAAEPGERPSSLFPLPHRQQPSWGTK